MLNHTYTSVNNANLVDCGKKQHIPSQPSALLRDNFLGEYRTELDKKKVLVNLGIATSLSLEWEYIKGDIARSESLMNELDSRTKYISEIDGFQKNITQGIKYLEDVVKNTQSGEDLQNSRIEKLESDSESIIKDLSDLKTYLTDTVDVDLNKIKSDLNTITEKVDNITELIQVSTKEGNALTLLSGEYPGLYVTDLSEEVLKASEDISNLQTDVSLLQEDIKTFVTRDELGGGDFDFVSQGDFDTYVNQNDEKISNLVNKSEFNTFAQQTSTKIDSLVNQNDFNTYIGSTDSKLSEIEEELKNTVKTGEDGHVDTLYVNTISKNNDDSNIKITDSFEVQSGIPLDVRFVVETLDDLLNIPVKTCYSGMGVIVNSLSALYILRKPENDATLTQDYIGNVLNWKCPEDLVTVALSRKEYEDLQEINPNVFYYIYEEEVSTTQEPVRENFNTEEEFKAAWQEWVQSLKVLSQEYMSASWGVDIETKLGQKASNDSITLILEELDKIKGTGDGPSLESLNESISQLNQVDQTIIERVDSILSSTDNGETGRLVTAETELSQVKDSLNNFVTKDYIQNAENDFIFVKKDDYESDKESFISNLQTELTTSKINSETVETDSILLNESSITIEDNSLSVDNNKLAFVQDVPKVEVLSQTDYNKKTESELDSNTYYYTYDDEESLATKSDLKKESDRIDELLLRIVKLEELVENLTSEE